MNGLTAKRKRLNCRLTGSAYPASDNPIVDLGYVRHQAIDFNQTGGYYNFSNIRFAAPPLGQLRFAVPQKPVAANSTDAVDNGGDYPKACPQALPEWEARAAQFIPSYLLARSTDVERDFKTLSQAATLSYAGIESEDCLFLDVFTPKSIFERGRNAKAPVLGMLNLRHCNLKELGLASHRVLPTLSRGLNLRLMALKSWRLKTRMLPGLLRSRSRHGSSDLSPIHPDSDLLCKTLS